MRQRTKPIAARPASHTQPGTPAEAVVGATRAGAVCACPRDSNGDGVGDVRAAGFCARNSAASKVRNFSGSVNLTSGSIVRAAFASSTACANLRSCARISA